MGPASVLKGLRVPGKTEAAAISKGLGSTPDSTVATFLSVLRGKHITKSIHCWSFLSLPQVQLGVDDGRRKGFERLESQEDQKLRQQTRV